MNLKRTLSMACAAMMLSASVPAYAKTMEFTLGSTSLYISENGISQTQIETAPYTENSRTMVPVRIISENFGALVTWSEEKQQVTITDGANNIVLTLGSNEAIVNGANVTLDVPAKEIGGRTMVPLRFISENLGKDVSYIEATKQVLISDEAPIMTVNNRTYTIDDYRFIISDQKLDSLADSVQAVKQTTNFLSEVAAVASAAEAENLITVSQNDMQIIADYMNENSSEIYKSSLVATGAGFYADYALSNAYLSIKSNLSVTDAAIEQIYNSDYVRAKHILIVTRDAQSGEAYSDADKIKAKNLAEDILERLKKGEDFDALCSQYNEDPGYVTYPDGYVFTRGVMVEEFENTAFTLEEGTISDIVETDYGYHIIKREPLAEPDQNTLYQIQSTLLSQKFNEIYNTCMASADIQMHMSDEEIALMISQ